MVVAVVFTGCMGGGFEMDPDQHLTQDVSIEPPLARSTSSLDHNLPTSSRRFPSLPSSAKYTNDNNNNADDLLYQHVNAFFFFKEKGMYDDYLQFNRSRTSTFTIFLFALLLSLLAIPYGFALAWKVSQHGSAVGVLHHFLLALLATNIALSWLVYYIQLAKLKRVTETTFTRILMPYSTHIQTILFVMAMVYCCFRLLFRVYSGRCVSHRYYDVWDCNPVADSNSIPIDSLILVLVMPFILVLMLKEVRFYAPVVSVVVAIVSVIVCTVHAKNGVEMTPVIVLYAILGLIIFYDLQRQSYIMYFINQKLRDTLAENERIADEMHANEMRSMIANVAHDLKTPLASFLSGVEYIGQVVLDLKHLMEKKKLLAAEDLEDFIVSITDCIGNVKSTNSFMLMTINRCIDYTKASKGFKLVPKYETINLHDTLMLPLNCMSDIQSRVAIHLNDFPTEICSHIITDKQWLQENILCLLSNAVKYSTDGEVTITISLRKPTVGNQTVNLINSVKELFTRKNSKHLNRVLSDGELGAVRISNQSKVSTPKASDAVVDFHEEVDHVEHDFDDKYRYMNRNKPAASADVFLVVEVEDHGIGISEEVMEGLFSPFKQAQRLAGGTGLGLYSLMKRVEALNGFCGVRGRKDCEKGTLFWFEIPYRPDHIYSVLSKSKKIKPYRSGRSLSSTVSFESKEATNGGSSFLTHKLHAHSESFDEWHGTKMPTLTRTLSHILSGGRSDEADYTRMMNATFCDSQDNTPIPITKQSSVADIASATKDVDTSLGLVQSTNDLRKALQLSIAPPPLKILLVEDTLSILKMTSMMLKRHGHNITCAENGEQALKRIEEQLRTDGVPFDVILMDLQMPVMDGLEAAKRLRSLEDNGQFIRQMYNSSTSTAPVSSSLKVMRVESVSSVDSEVKSEVKPDVKHVVIGVSANSDHETMESAYEVGFDSFIAKPFSIDTFYETFEAIRTNHKNHS